MKNTPQQTQLNIKASVSITTCTSKFRSSSKTLLILLITFFTAYIHLPKVHAAEHVKQIGVQFGFAGVAGTEGYFSGYGGALAFSYSLTDALVLATNVTASSNQVVDPIKGGRSLLLSQSAGLLYRLDILHIVPYFGALAGLYEVIGAVPKTQFKFGIQLAAGLDYLFSRDFSMGIELRAHALPLDFLAKPDNPVPFYTTMFLKAEYVWGWF